MTHAPIESAIDGPRPAEERDARVARLFAPLGDRPLTKAQAKRAGQLLGLHWTTIYRLRQRYLERPGVEAVAPRVRGPKSGRSRISADTDRIVREVLESWLPAQKQMAHPTSDICAEVARRCERAGIKPPGRSTIVRRLAAYRDARALDLAMDPTALIPPGSLSSAVPMGIVQIDHTLADVIIVDDRNREAWKRPWLSVAIDIATRCIVGFYVSMERPNAATVALLLTRIVQPKVNWLSHVGVACDWPMHGMPHTLHLDNAAEFKSRALRSGCAQYGIELQYRPVRRPHFGGHVERVIRTLMERMRGLPGATGGSTKGRAARKPEKYAAMTLAELERWLAIEIGQRYHHSEHRGLSGATPASAWSALAAPHPPRQLPPEPDATLQFMLRFLPMVRRTIQRDGLVLMRLRYWHPMFAAWREQRRPVVVRYHPDDLSRVFVSATGRQYYEARFADLRRPAISLWEQRLACRVLRSQGNSRISEQMIFQALDRERLLILQAKRETARQRRARTAELESKSVKPPPAHSRKTAPPATDLESEVDYAKDAPDFPVEQW